MSVAVIISKDGSYGVLKVPTVEQLSNNAWWCAVLRQGSMGYDEHHATDITDLLFFFAPLFLLIGMTGFCILCAQRYGTLGKMGCIISLSGLAVGTIGSLVGVWVEPLRLAYWLGFRFLCIGLVLLGVATIKAKALPGGWSALPLALGLLGLGRTLFMFFAVTMGSTGLNAPEAGDELGTFLSSWAGTLTSMLGLLFGLGWVCLGYALWAGKTEAT